MSYANKNVTKTLVKKFKNSTHPKDNTFLSLYPKLKNENKNPLGKITSRGRPEDVPKRRPMDVPIWSSI